jgi:hypothetical protein
MLLAAQVASAQVTTGIPPFSSLTPSSFDTVDNANLNVNFGIPIFSRAGLGIPFSYVLGYNSSLWSPVTASGSLGWTAAPNWGWQGITAAQAGYVSFQSTLDSCTAGGTLYYYPVYGPWFYYDAVGTPHQVNIYTTPGYSQCGIAAVPSASGTAIDDSGYTIVITSQLVATVYNRSGMKFLVPLGSSPGSSSITDPNNNTISASVVSNLTTYQDTLGTTPLTVTTGSTSTTYKYPSPPNGTQVSYTVNYSSQTVQTNFGCSGIAEFGATQEYLISSIKLPDGTSYSFSYETTPGHSPNVTGRLAKVTLPTGGTITYAYSGGNNGITCTDGSTATLTRTLNPGGAWTYAHSESGTAWTTTITHPQSDVTNYDFVQVSGSQLAYETQRTVKNSGGTTLLTVNTCYNGASIPCTTTAITFPLANRTVQTTLPNLSPSKTYTAYSSYSLPTETDEYDYGGSTPLRKTLTQYATLRNPNVVDRPSSIQVENGAGTVLAQATYGYDGNGNLLSEAHTNTGGSPSSISRSFTYNTNGTLATATDFNSSSNLTT